MTKTYTIARRAFSKYTVIETGITGWLVAMDRASKMQAANRDGEYFVFFDGEEMINRDKTNHQCEVQRAFAYL